MNSFVSALRRIWNGPVAQATPGGLTDRNLPPWRPPHGALSQHTALPVVPAPFVPGAARRKVPRKPEKFSVVAVINGANQRSLVFVQQAPQVRVTKWNLGGYHSDRVLSFPYILFIVAFYRGVFENLYAFFLRQPYCGMATQLFQTVLPNAADSGWVCIGNDATKDELMFRTGRLDTWEARAGQVLDFFWNETHFNDHVIDRLTARGPALHPNLVSLAAWEAASRFSPNFVNSVQWEFAGTVDNFLSNRMGARQ